MVTDSKLNTSLYANVYTNAASVFYSLAAKM